MAVLFTSEHDLERAENLRAIYDAYHHPKQFVRGIRCMKHAEMNRYDAVVCDTLPKPIKYKQHCKCFVIGHGITGDKFYALDERTQVDSRAFPQIDFAINASTKTAHIVARQFGIPIERVFNIGMPRTDAYIGKRKGDGHTVMSQYRRAYLYAPTFRGPNDGYRLPYIDWAKLDRLLEDDELIVVKRHYYTEQPIVDGEYANIVEVSNMAASGPYLIDCDVLLTDYSSILFDAYVLGKPSVLAVDDADAYLRTRGMYFDYPSQYSSRWLAVEGNEEKLLEHLRAACITGMRQTERDCLSTVADMCDGHSCERLADLIWSTVCEYS